MLNNSDILFSIKPKYMKLILDKNKNFEYRNKYWKVDYPSWFYVYISSPVSSLKYCILLGKPYKSGEKIPYNSYGTDRFNNLDMNRKYAYPILKVKKINDSLSLEQLRSFDVTPPQDYIYISKKLLLFNYLLCSHLEDITL